MTLALAVLMLRLTGVGLLTVGVAPGWEKVGQLVVYLVAGIADVSFWLGLAQA